jgi:quercetin dioxygenase-like cupin family protein
MIPAKLRSFNYAGFTFNVYNANNEEGLPKHDHDYDHGTMCLAGKIAVRKEGKEVFLTEENPPVNLRAGEWHEIQAVEPDTIFLNIFRENKTM